MYPVSRSLSLVSLAFSVVVVLAVAGTAAPEKDCQTLSLEDCLSLARQYNPALGAARERVKELVADYEAARSKFFPRLALISYYQRVDPERLSPGGGITTQNPFGREGLTSLTGKQIIFDGLKTYNNTQAATFGKKAQQQEVARTADEVVFQVTEAFYRLQEAKEDLKVAAEALRERQEFLKITEAFYQAGKVTRLDAFQAKSQVLEAAKDFDSLWQQAEQTSPEIKRLKLELAQGQALIKGVRGGYFPEVSLQGSTGVRHRDVGGTREEWLGGVFMEFPFFEGGLTRAQVAKAFSQYRQLLEKQRDRLNALRVDLMTGWKEQENARQGVVTSRQNVATSEEAYQSSLALYRVGKAIGLDVLTSQVELTRARLSLIRYQVGYKIGRAKVKQIIGGGPADTALRQPRQGEGK